LQEDVLRKSTRAEATKTGTYSFLSILEFSPGKGEKSSNFLLETLRISAEKVPQFLPDEGSKAK
jgi:hypothetical protein